MFLKDYLNDMEQSISAGNLASNLCSGMPLFKDIHTTEYNWGWTEDFIAGLAVYLGERYRLGYVHGLTF